MDADPKQIAAGEGPGVAQRDERPEGVERRKSAADEKLAEADGVLQAELDELFSNIDGDEDDDKQLDPTDELIQHLSVDAQDEPRKQSEADELDDGAALDDLLGEMRDDAPPPSAAPKRELVAEPEPEELEEPAESVSDVSDDEPEKKGSLDAPGGSMIEGLADGLLDIFDSLGKEELQAERQREHERYVDSLDAARLREEMAIDEMPPAPLPEPTVEQPPAPRPEPQRKLAPPPKRGTSGDPWWLRLLVFINRPLENLSDTQRDAVGKIGIVTLANALALIAYVLILG